METTCCEKCDGTVEIGGRFFYGCENVACECHIKLVSPLYTRVENEICESL